MPTATSYNYFSSINTSSGFGGGGNGLPLFDIDWDGRSDGIDRRINVNDYDRYQVLNIQQLAPLFWNLYKVNCDVSIGSTSVSSTEISSSDDAYQPQDRALAFTDGASSTDISGGENSTLSLASTSKVRALYNGTFTRENFLGFGFDQLIIASASFANLSAESRLKKKTITSFIDETADTSVTTRTYSTITLNGADFVQEEITTDDPGTGTPVNPAKSVGDITIEFFTY